MALALVVLLAAIYSFMWVFITIGLTSKSAQAATGTTTLLIVPLAFVSAAYVPADSLPGWMQPVANNQPFTVFSNAVRSLTLGGADALGLGHSTAYWSRSASSGVPASWWCSQASPSTASPVAAEPSPAPSDTPPKPIAALIPKSSAP